MTNVQCPFREHSVNIQCSFREHQVSIKGTFSAHLVQLEVDAHEPPSQLQEALKITAGFFFVFFLRLLTLSPPTLEIHHLLQAVEATCFNTFNGGVVFSVITRG
jgi:hypothetical protein